MSHRLNVVACKFLSASKIRLYHQKKQYNKGNICPFCAKKENNVRFLNVLTKKILSLHPLSA